MRKNAARKLLDAIVGRLFMACLILYDRLRRLLVARYRASLEQLTVDSILVIKLCCLGDGVLATPAIRALKQAYPDAKLTVICTPRNIEAFRGHDFIDDLVELPLTGLEGLREMMRSGLGAFRRAVAAGRSCRPQLAIDLDLYFKITPILAFMSGAPVRAGFDTAGKNRAGLFTHSAPRDPNKHEVECFLDILGEIGIKATDLDTCLWRDPEAAAQVKAILAETDLDLSGGYAVFAPGSSANWPVKRWAEGRFAELGLRIVENRGLPVILIGAPFEQELAERIAEQVGPGAISLAGRTSIRETIELLRGAAFVVSNDSGPMHLAAAVGVPVVGIFGPTNPAKWRPWSDDSRVVAALDGCDRQPCYYLSSMPECDAADCIGRITVEDVDKAVSELVPSP